MGKRINFILVALTMLTIFFGFASQAYACTCAELTVVQQRENASAVFSGTVVKKTRSDAVEKNGVEVTFKVDRVWKGSIEEETVVYTGATADLYPFENLCAPPFKVGQKYVVFAFGQNDLTTDTCAGTLSFPEAKKLETQLGESTCPKSKHIDVSNGESISKLWSEKMVFKRSQKP